MENMQIGAFIRDRRLQLGMTQQQLADKLNLTDKAVSKWERSVSYPDITILRELADALEVSVSELLAGRQDPQPSPVPPEVEDVVLDTVSYAETARQKNSGWKFWLFVALSAGCLIAVLVLCIVDRFRFRWSQIPIQSIALGWAVCYPLLRVERYPVRRSLTVLTFAIIPYLASVFTPVFYIWGHLPDTGDHTPVSGISVGSLLSVYEIPAAKTAGCRLDLWSGRTSVGGARRPGRRLTVQYTLRNRPTRRGCQPFGGMFLEPRQGILISPNSPSCVR